VTFSFGGPDPTGGRAPGRAILSGSRNYVDTYFTVCRLRLTLLAGGKFRQ